jgi:hypothetical protein
LSESGCPGFEDVQDVFLSSSIFSEILLIQIFHNINIKYYPVNPLILVILIQTVKFYTTYAKGNESRGNS